MSFTITLGTSSLEITLDPAASNTAQLIPKTSIREVSILTRGILKVLFSHQAGYDLSLNLDLTTISNQPTWSAGTLTSDQACITSFNSWLTSSSGGGGGAVTLPITSRTFTRTLVTTSGGVATGARYIALETSEDFTGTIAGVIASPSRVYPIAVNQNDDTIGAIIYTITTGNIIINKLV